MVKIPAGTVRAESERMVFPLAHLFWQMSGMIGTLIKADYSAGLVAATGSANENAAPPSGSFVARSSPPCSRTMP